MKHIKEFSRFADVYSRYNSVQKQVAQELAALIKGHPKHIVDLGCGSGTLYKELNFVPETFLGVDLSEKMLEEHPKEKGVELWCDSFDDAALFRKLQNRRFDVLLSSASLQWSKDLGAAFEKIAHLHKPIALTLFTSNTFKTLHDEAGTQSPLYSRDEIQALSQNYFGVDAHFSEYVLRFKNNRELFNYLKKSGVSGNEKQLNYKETKRLMREYPVDYLEFEVAFIVKESA